MDAAEEMDALASPRVQSHKDSTVDGGAARPRASIFEGFSLPGLRGRAAAKVTAPAKQTRPDKNSLFVVPSKSVTAARLPLNDGNPNPSPNPGATPLPWP